MILERVRLREKPLHLAIWGAKQKEKKTKRKLFLEKCSSRPCAYVCIFLSCLFFHLADNAPLPAACSVALRSFFSCSHFPEGQAPLFSSQSHTCCKYSNLQESGKNRNPLLPTTLLWRILRLRYTCGHLPRLLVVDFIATLFIAHDPWHNLSPTTSSQ